MKPTPALIFFLLAIVVLAPSGCVTSTAPDGTKITRFDSATASDLAKLGTDVLERALALKEKRDGKQITPLK